MKELNREKLNKVQIEQHLKSAVSSLTPNVLEKIDLKAAQEPVPVYSKIQKINRRLRLLAGAMAACLCLLVLSGGGFYVYQNGRVDSVIGIDVNPSIELSVNRANKVLEAVPLNQDAIVILDDMKLKGVDLDIAVNAVIGSMVKHGYFNDLDNAILVTVSNDSISKADSLRQKVVGDIQTSLQENQIQAVVYDQQVIQTDEIQRLADQYGISYGKAYFLKELISQNPSLTTEDMERLAPLTMEQIASEITEGLYALSKGTGDETPIKPPQTTAVPTLPETTEESTEETTTQPETTTAVAGTTAPHTQPATAATTPETTAPPPTTAEVVVDKNNIKIDNVDYDNGVVSITFSSKVKWSNPTVSVKDQYGNAYSAMIGETDSTYCEILVSGLEEDMQYEFVIGGIKKGSTGKATTVKGTFETPVISSDATEATTEDVDDTDETEETTMPDGALENPTKDTAAKETPPVAETSTAAETTAGNKG